MIKITGLEPDDAARHIGPARGGLHAFHWPGVAVTVAPIAAFVLWRAGWLAAARLLIGADGQLEMDVVNHLLTSQNRRRVTLNE